MQYRLVKRTETCQPLPCSLLDNVVGVSGRWSALVWSLLEYVGSVESNNPEELNIRLFNAVVPNLGL